MGGASPCRLCALDSPGVQPATTRTARARSEEHTSELQSRCDIVWRPRLSTLSPYTTLFRSTHVVLSQHRLNNQCHQSARPRDPRPVGSKKPSDLVALRWVGLRLVGSAHWTHRACSQPRQERQG